MIKNAFAKAEIYEVDHKGEAWRIYCILKKGEWPTKRKIKVLADFLHKVAKFIVSTEMQQKCKMKGINFKFMQLLNNVFKI